MNGPVDVLAVLESAAMWCQSKSAVGSDLGLVDVRSAVAELIEAGNEVLRVSCTQGVSDDEYWPAVQKFDAALARVQGVSA